MAISAISLFSSFAQGNSFNIGINLGGGGAFSAYTRVRGLDGFVSRFTIPGLYLSYEHEVQSNFTLGPYIGHTTTFFRNNNFDFNRVAYRNLWIGVKTVYYFDDLIGIEDKYDLYGTASAGVLNSFRVERSQTGQDNINSFLFRAPIIDLRAGARYHIKDEVSLFLEAGFGSALLIWGATIHL